MKKSFKYLYGPVYSWRLGMSLGIDPLTQGAKVCNFDCIYCQLGKTKRWANFRQEFVKTKAIIDEVKRFPAEIAIDHYTFSGRGEPTLAKNLGEMIREVKKLTGGKIAVITNSSLFPLPEVRKDLHAVDYVLAKLDAFDDKSFDLIAKPMAQLSIKKIYESLIHFRSEFKGKLALQIMFIKQDEALAERLAEMARKIKPDEVQVNTPLRPSPIKPLDEKSIRKIAKAFEGLNVSTAYDKETRAYTPIDVDATKLRHGNYLKK